jgi:hypothetical protein
VPSAPSSPKSVVLAAQAARKGKELRKGRTRAEVERAKVELEAARVARTQSERVNADEDSTVVMQRMTRAEEDVRDKEKELTIALRKDEAARADLQNAEQAARREAMREQLMRLADAGKAVNASIRNVGLAVDTVIPLLNEARAFGNDEINTKLTDAIRIFRVRLLDACGKMPGCATGFGLFLKHEEWSASLPVPSDADRAVK